MIDLIDTEVQATALPRTIGSMGQLTSNQKEPDSRMGRAVCDIGYMLRPVAWGRGYATEALTALVDAIFEKTDRTHITAETDAENRSSWRVLEKVGFARIDQRELEHPTLGKRPFYFYQIARPTSGRRGEVEQAGRMHNAD
jgi:GNAT superfamily N-acetyltransferase